MKKNATAIHTRLFRYVRSMRLSLAVMAVLSILTGVFIVMQAHYLAQIVNGVFLGEHPLSQVAIPLTILLLVMIARAVLIWVSEVVAQNAACTVKKTLRQRLFAHLLKLGPLYAKGERSGELVQTLSEGVESLDAYFSQFVPQLCATLFIPAIVLIAIFTIDWLSGVLLLVTMPLLPFFMMLIGKQARAMTQRRWQVLSQMSAHFLDVLQGLATLKLFGRSQAQRETVRRVSEHFGEMTMKVLRIAFLSSLVLEMGATICTALVAVEIGLRLLYGTMPFTQAFFVLLLTPEFFGPLRSLGTQFHASMSSSAGAQRIFDLLEVPVQEQSVGASVVMGGWEDLYGRPRRLASVPRKPRSLQFQDVSVSYHLPDGKRQPALQSVSFSVQAGKKVVLVGPTGAGKSTIAHLLLRFLEPEQGTICLDGLPMHRFPVEQWRKQVAWQPQRPTLFDMTVTENMRIGRSDATLDEVFRAARQACIHDEIQALPHGYDTVIGERGTRLSGGQIQRLSLARALLKNAPILVLDEVTSTLDSESETQVLRVIETLALDRIVLMIAHRLNTIRMADQIVVLHEGKVVDVGSHYALLQRSKIYQALVSAYADGEVLV
jgi:ATP-binding cassette subfamily C protein CydD